MSQGGISQRAREVQCVEIKCHNSRIPVVVSNREHLAPGSSYASMGATHLSC